MGSCLSIKKRPSNFSTRDPHDPHATTVPDLLPECLVQQQGNEETPGFGDQVQHVSSSDSSTDQIEEVVIKITECTGPEQGNKVVPGGQLQQAPSSSGPTDENGEMIITTIRVTDVALGLRRLPAGFSAVVHYNGLRWRTTNKPSSVDNDIIEWNCPIPIPSDLSATVRLDIYASFEFQPILGTGEQLRELTISVEQLLDHSAKRFPFAFIPQDGDIVSSCSSIFVTVERQKREHDDPHASTILGPHSSIPESRSKLEDTTDDGHRALLRYRKHGERRDLERSIEEFEHALRICPLDHPCRAAAQSNLAMARLIFSQVEDVDASLDVPLQLYRDALVARPAGHPDRPATLIHLAEVHLVQFQKQADHLEEAQARGLLVEAMQLSGVESHEKRVAIFMQQLHIERRADPGERDGQSLMVQDSTSHLTKEELRNSSNMLLDHFEEFGDLADLQQAIAILEGLVQSTATRDSWYSAILLDLGRALRDRFERLGDLRDLEDAISAQRDAVDLTPHGHPHKCCRLNILSVSLYTRFEYLGEFHDLEDAISTRREAVDLTPHGHPHKPSHLSSLGHSLRIRYKRLGELRDLENAISTMRDAVDLAPHGHPDRLACLNTLAISLGARFEHLGELRDLEDAISTLRDAADLAPHGHPDKLSYLHKLGMYLRTRFERLGDLRDLEDAISAQRDVVDLTPDGHPDKSCRLNILGGSFFARFWRTGELRDLENAISTQRDAVDLTPHGHPHKLDHLDDLSVSLDIRYERLWELCDLEDAISTQRVAVDLTPDGHSDKLGRLCNLVFFLKTRFDRVGELCDLEDAISIQRRIVALIPVEHPEKFGHLGNLGLCLRTRFERLRDLHDLEEAISLLRNAVDFAPRRHPARATCLHNLGVALSNRFDRLEELRDIEEAISILRDVVDLIPHEDPERPDCLNSLGVFLSIRFGHLRELLDLEEAISAQRNAVDLTPDGHPRKPGYLNNLGASFQTRFERVRELRDLEDAISIKRAAVNLTPHGEPHKSCLLNNLGISLRTRFECLGELHDLEDAISAQRDAIALTPHGHPEKPRHLTNLGNSFRIRFERLGDPHDLEKAISLYCHAASSPVGPVDARFHASQLWILCARCVRHHTLLHAYSVALSLLPQFAWIGLPLTHRYNQLSRGVDIVRQAAAAALESGLPETAVEWLEQGRSIVWGELFQLRSSYDDLSSAHPDHARRLRELSAALELSGAAREKSLTTEEQTQDVAQCTTESPRYVADKHRSLAIERDRLLQEIRQLPGFEQFLLRKQYSHLRASAQAGPVVILNAAETRCDALIVFADVDHVVHVPLLNFTSKRSADLQNILRGFVRHAREGRPVPQDGISWESILPPLWKGIVKPVLDAVALSIPGELSRIFWCPTGPLAFLPIHAAGLYDMQYSGPGHKVFDFVVSSYVPTLSILFAPSNSTVSSTSRDLRILAVRQPPSDGHAPLPGVRIEMERIKDVISNSAPTFVLEPSTGTVEEVLALMKESDWVHFACHGIQDGADSGLCLANNRCLRLRDIIALSRPCDGLAFLSACQTAMGEKHLSDEAIHMAAGMLFAGYGGVVGTMWSISDRLAPDVARAVYVELFRNGKRPDYREAARALHGAIGDLRDRDMPFAEWVPFIHVGL